MGEQAERARQESKLQLEEELEQLRKEGRDAVDAAEAKCRDEAAAALKDAAEAVEKRRNDTAARLAVEREEYKNALDARMPDFTEALSRVLLNNKNMKAK
jgi:F0F1-type ATP synthase membrane subunit b/b'